MPHEKIPLRISDRVDHIVWRLGTFVSYWVLVLMIITFYEVVARYAFNRPTFWAHETSEMLFGAFMILGAGMTLCRLAMPAHIKMDIFYARFSPRKRTIIDLVSGLMFFTFGAVLLWRGGVLAWQSCQIGEHSSTVWSPPLYPLRVCLPVGVFLIVVMGVIKFIRNLTRAITGRGTA